MLNGIAGLAVSDTTKLNKPHKLLLMMLKLPAAMMPSQ
jgi:hypothetical protein